MVDGGARDHGFTRGFEVPRTAAFRSPLAGFEAIAGENVYLRIRSPGSRVHQLNFLHLDEWPNLGQKTFEFLIRVQSYPEIATVIVVVEAQRWMSWWRGPVSLMK